MFVASDGWVHCGKVKDGLLQEGRIVSVNKKAEILRLTNNSHSGAQYEFLKDGQNIADISGRLNLCKDPKNWLSMQPNPLRYSDEDGVGFGEVN